MKLYLIVETSEKEIPWFCGTGEEVAKVLGYKNQRVLHCAVSKGQDILGGLFRIEKLEVSANDAVQF